MKKNLILITIFLGLVILIIFWWNWSTVASHECPIPFNMSDDLYEKSDRWGWKKFVWSERGLSFDIPNDWYVDDAMFSDNLMLYSRASIDYYLQECNSDKSLRLGYPLHDMFISYDKDLKNYLERIDLYKDQNSLADFLNNDNRYNKYVKTEVDGNPAYDVDKFGGIPTIYVERENGFWQFGYDSWNSDVEGIMKSVDFAG